MAKTLYISDLDGTLLKNDQTVSQFTADTINSLVQSGMLFSYATARSYATASIVTKGLCESLPVIVYNGTFILENGSQKQLHAVSFSGGEADEILNILLGKDIYPIVYSFAENKERFSYIPHYSTAEFIATKAGDARERTVYSKDDLYFGEIFHFSCIDEYEKLLPLYERFKDRFSCVLYLEQYGGKWWLEVQPKAATKASAALKLKELLGCDRIVAFGDGKNDIPLFKIADESYAVKNADEALKSIASGTIGSNEEDGVAKWLKNNANH